VCTHIICKKKKRERSLKQYLEEESICDGGSEMLVMTDRKILLCDDKEKNERKKF